LPEEEVGEMCERCFTLFIMELYKDNPNVSFVDSDNKPTTDPDKVEWFNGLGFKKGSKYAPKS
jgi:hypothetical protein